MSSLIDLLAGMNNQAESGKYYHVAISCSAAGKIPVYEFVFDINEPQLHREIVLPYCKNNKIFFSGRLLARDQITYIRISETAQPSKSLWPIVEGQVRDSLAGDRLYSNLQTGPLQGIFPDGAESYFYDKVAMGVINAGKDVTSRMITSSLISDASTDTSQARQVQPSRNPHRVFVIHGRNDVARNAMFIFLRSIGLDPIEWEKAVGMTGKPTPNIREILDAAFSEAQAVVVLMTPDDEAQLRVPFRNTNDPGFESELTGQARPNVLFEAGMAVCQSPDRTILVELGHLRPFSDIAGLHVIRFDGSTHSRQVLADRLKLVQCTVDLRGKTDWQTAGDFGAAMELIRSSAESTRLPDQSDLGEKSHGATDLNLSANAKYLLAEAAQSSSGTIDVVVLDHGRSVMANGKEFCQTGNPRSEAAAIGALNELVVYRLVEVDRANPGLYKVTSKGWDITEVT